MAKKMISVGEAESISEQLFALTLVRIVLRDKYDALFKQQQKLIKQKRWPFAAVEAEAIKGVKSRLKEAVSKKKKSRK